MSYSISIKNIYNLIISFFRTNKERSLYTMGLFFFVVGLSSSITLIGVSLGFFFVAVVWGFFSFNKYFNFKWNKIVTVVGIFILWTQLSSIYSLVSAHYLSPLLGRNTLEYFIFFLAFYMFFDFKRDKYFLILFFIVSLFNSYFRLSEFFSTMNRGRDLLGNPNRGVSLWSSISLISTAVYLSLKKSLKKYILFLFIIVNLVVLVSYQSSTTYALFPIIFMIMLISLCKPKTSLILVFLSLFFLIIGIFSFQNNLLPAKIQTKMSSIVNSRERSMGLRFYTWRFTSEVIQEHPIMGVATGNLPKYMYKTKSAETYTGKHFKHAHNTYLQVAAEHGVVGFIIFLIVFITIFYRVSSKLVFQKNTTQKYFLISLLFAISSILLLGLVEAVHFNGISGHALWAMVGIVSKVTDDERYIDVDS